METPLGSKWWPHPLWGAGDEAAHNAGIMKSGGRFYILLPKSVEIPEKHRYSAFRRGGDAAHSFVYND